MVISSRTMVRPWLVALLVLLTDRRTFGINRPPYATVSAHAEAAPATAKDVDAAGTIILNAAAAANITEIATVRCSYKGRSYEPGSSVNTDQPCLRCTCVKGSLVCHLRVCPELPDPPPQGCVIVHKKNKCCAHLQCFYEQFAAVHSKLFSSKSENRFGPSRMENSAIVTFDDGLSKGCLVNGTIYAEGSAMDSSSLCEYCYCIKGRQQCVRPQCSMTIPGCAAVYKKHTCCPVRYDCSPLSNTVIKNTTDAPTTEMSLSARLKDCRLNGRLISLGEPVIGVARSSCETCFCINGQVRCDKVICPPIRAQISPNCGPVYSEGHCCPTSYNCTTASRNDTVHVSRTTTTTTTETSSIMSSSTPSTTTAVDDDFIIPLGGSSSSPYTVTTMPAESENAIFDDLKNATGDSIAMEDPMESRHANPAGLIHEDFGGLNVTEKSNNFEMDYDEPTLPPSLPNLKIIPFVAADAVFDEPAGVAYDNNYQPMVEHVYNVSEVEEPTSLVLNSFSPPVETEGGFVPKDPPGGAVYGAEKIRTTTERILAAVQPVTTVHHEDTVVAGHHQPIGSAWCLSNGIKYKHGELLTDPSACDICVCIDAKIVCQENCPAVKVGCQRISDPNNSTCCGRIVCNEQSAESEDIATERVVIGPKPDETTSGTTAAVIEHIVYSAPPTERPTIATSPASLTPLSVQPATAAPTSTIRPVSTLAPTTHETPAIDSSTSTSYAGRPTSTAAPKPVDNDEDYSFESMFSFLFGGDAPTDAPPAETRIEHRTDDEIDATEIGTADVKPHRNTVSIMPQHGATQVKPQHGTADLKPLQHNTVNTKPQHGTADVFKPQTVTVPSLVRQPLTEPPSVRTPGSSQSGVDATYDKDNGDDKNTRVQADFHAGVKTRLQNATAGNAQDTAERRTDAKPLNLHADAKLRPPVKIHQEPVAVRPPQTDAAASFAHRRPEHNAQQHVPIRPNLGAVPPKIKTDGDSGAAPTALKISGCNIYGRMYRVGKIIAELSNPCLECMCTEIGVHCNQLKC